MRLSTLLAAAGLVPLSIAGYVIEDDYFAGNFFDMFTFFDSTDPTHGFVDYVTGEVANSSGLIDVDGDGSIYMGVDHTTTTTSGRPSVRITSNKSYSSGLVVIDLSHFPGGICGTWPAFWMVGPDWPNGGEIDILEGTNTQEVNQMTLHTGSGCSISSNSAMSGTLSSNNCASSGDDNTGCAIMDNQADTYSQFNEKEGGVFATELDPDNNQINIWFFPRSSIPADLSSDNPDPTSWGNPSAHFSGGCDVATHFKDLQLVFDTTFCGDWAGDSWSSDSTCSALASTCDSYVANNPSAFTNAYWSVNSLKVYSAGAATTSSSAAPSSTSSSAIIPSISIPLTSIIPSIIPSISIPLTGILPSIPTPSSMLTTFAISTKPATPYTPITGASTPIASVMTPPLPPFPAGNKTMGFPTGSGTAPLGGGVVTPAPAKIVAKPVQVNTTDIVTDYVTDIITDIVTDFVTDTIIATPAANTPTTVAANAWFADGQRHETSAAKVAHMMAHRKRAHGAWRLY